MCGLCRAVFVCSIHFQSSLLPGLCRLLRLLQLFQPLVTSSFSWSIWTLYRFRQPSRSKLGPTKTQCWLKCKDVCSMVGLLKSQIIGGVQQNWRRQELSVLDGCVLWGARVVVLPPGRERVIQRDTCTPSHWKDEEVGKKPCVVGEPQWRSGSRSANLYQVSVKSTPSINLVPRPSRTCKKECLVF